MKVRASFLICALLMIVSSYAQNNKVIDSLELVLKTAKADTLKVKNLNFLSAKYFNIGKYELAMKKSESALLLAEKLKFKKGIADSYNSIGGVYRIQGNNSESLKNSLVALKISEKLDYKKGIVKSYNNIGNTYLFS